MSLAIDAITLAWGIAALLFIHSLGCVSPTSERARRYAASAGVAILCAAAVYGMDAINMPEIMGAFVIGAAAGLLAREWPGVQLTRLMTMLAGMAGCAALCAALAVWINPYAFGLIVEGQDGVATCDMPMLGATLLTGFAACLLAMIGMVRRRMARPVLLALAVAMAGWSAAALAFLLQNIGMVIAGGLAGAGGTAIALRMCGGERGKGLADTGRRP